MHGSQIFLSKLDYFVNLNTLKLHGVTAHKEQSLWHYYQIIKSL
jgi:hypothetical protein